MNEVHFCVIMRAERVPLGFSWRMFRFGKLLGRYLQGHIPVRGLTV